MNVFISEIDRKVCIGFLFLLFIPMTALCKSDFRVAYKVDDQIISNYDVDQARKLHNLLTSSKHDSIKIEKIVVNDKIKEIYADRLKIVVSNAELDSHLNNFLKSNKMNVGRLKSLMNANGIDIETFYMFLKENIRWQKVLDKRFGYKINSLVIKDAIPLAPTPQRIEKEYIFSEIFISYKQWDPQQAALIANRLEIELRAGADFDKAVKKFSSAQSKTNKGKVGPVKKSRLSKNFIKVLDRLKKNEVSSPLASDEGLTLLKLDGVRSYKIVKTPKLSVTYSVSTTSSGSDVACSEEKQIRGPILLSRVEKKIRDVLIKVMPGESYNLLDNNGITRLVTLCEKFIIEERDNSLSFENAQKNEEALRLSNALILELRRNTTVVKK